jgi:hypothetical protein
MISEAYFSICGSKNGWLGLIFYVRACIYVKNAGGSVQRLAGVAPDETAWTPPGGQTDSR